MKLLFLCVANSARSQLAEGIAKHLFGPNAQIESAGSQPSGSVNPLALAALGENGIILEGAWSKSYEQLSAVFLRDLSYVITLCAEEICPHIPSQAQRLHWPIPDPAAVGTLAAFRDARDTIEAKLVHFGKTRSLLVRHDARDVN